MTTLEQLPGTLNLKIGRVDGADGLSLHLDFDISLSGYTFEAKVIKQSDGSEVDFEILETDLDLGQITLVLTNEQVNSLGTTLRSDNPWYLKWTYDDVPRTILTGSFTVVDPN